MSDDGEKKTGRVAGVKVMQTQNSRSLVVNSSTVNDAKL